jgi:UDP-glucose 4-epimerase
MKNKKVLVTGGAGFIGSNLVQKLISDDNDVVVIDNLSSGFISNIAHFKDINFINGDIRNIDDVKKAIKGVEVVFHLAASVGNKRSIDFPILDSETNVLGTINILNECVRNGVRKIVTSSSAGIFGELKTIPIKEDHPIEPDSPYGCSKLCEEKLCLSYSKLYDIEAVCLRYFNVYGPNQRFDAYGNVIPIFVYKMLHNEPIIVYGDGSQTRDFVHVNDIVQANINSANSYDVNEAFNIASGQRVSINYLISLIGENYKQDIKIEYIDKRPGDVMHSLADISFAKNKIHFDPKVNLQIGIQEYVEWAKSFYAKP